MSIFDLLGQAGAGFTRGLAQGEQLKYNERQKKQASDQNTKYRQQQFELALRKQQFDEKRAGVEDVNKFREVGLKSWLDLGKKMATDQNWVAGLTPGQRQLYTAHYQQLGNQLANPATSAAAWLQTFAQVPEKYGATDGSSGAQEPSQQPSANTPPDTNLYRIHSQEPIAQPDPNAMQDYVSSRVPQFNIVQPQPNKQVAPDFIPQQAQPPTIEGLIAQGFDPSYAAKAVKDYQSGVASQAGARRSNAAAVIDEARGPYAGQQAAADVTKSVNQGHLAGVQANVLTGRLALDQGKFTQAIHQWQLEYAASRTDANRKFTLDQNAQRITEFTARSADLLRQVQAGLGEQHIQNLRAELAQMAKLDPGLKLFADHFDDMFDKTLAGTYLNKEKAAAFAQGLEQYGMSVADVVKNVAATAAPNPFQGTPQGSTVGAPPPGTPVPQIPQGQAPGTPYAPMVAPQGGPPMLPPTAGLAPAQVGITPEMAAQFEDNRNRFNNGTFGPPLKAQPRKGKPQGKPAAKKQEPAAAPALPRTIAAPNYPNKSEPTTKPGKTADHSGKSTAALLKRLAVIAEKKGK